MVYSRRELEEEPSSLSYKPVAGKGQPNEVLILLDV